MASSLEPGKSVHVDVESVYAHALAPFPTKIKQAEKQLVVFNGNVYLYSPYKITTQTTTVTLSSSSVESYSKSPKPVAQSDKTITYGPYEAREPFTEVTTVSILIRCLPIKVSTSSELLFWICVYLLI